MGEVELRLPSEVAYVSLARLVVTVAARQAGMENGRVEDLKIAVSEATTNAIRAHQRNGRDDPVILSFGPHQGRFEVTIRDTGPGFEPEPAAAADKRDWRAEGGLGVMLIRNLADEVTFRRGHGMHVHLCFTVNLGGNGAPG